MEQPALRILNGHRIMAISTVRPDGWPQTTVVGYTNRGFEVIFMVFRGSQKFANIAHNDHVSIAVAREPEELSRLEAVYASGHAREITDPKAQQEAWRLLMQRHSNLAGFQIPSGGDAVFMRVMCEHVSVLDFTQGIGHREQLTLNGEGKPVDGHLGEDNWPLMAAGQRSS